jgi:hypothetical protein
MKKWLLLFLIAGVAVMFAAAVFYIRERRIPFVRPQDNWSVGIYVGETPFAFHEPDFVRNPVLTVLDVDDAPARFLADPFLIREGDLWYMFFEIYRWDTEQGDLSVATSKDLRNWNYEGIVLDEPFHLSYPYVFEWQGDYYMIPESFEANSVRLYRAESFPFQWSYVATLIEGKDFLDNSLAYYNDKWWLFTSFVGNKTLEPLLCRRSTWTVAGASREPDHRRQHRHCPAGRSDAGLREPPVPLRPGWASPVW